MAKVNKAPSDSQRSGNRERAAWERSVHDQIGDTNLSLGEAEKLLFLMSENLTRLQNLVSVVENLTKEVALITDHRPRYSELRQRIDELEKLIWQSPLSN